VREEILHYNMILYIGGRERAAVKANVYNNIILILRVQLLQ